MARKKNYVTHNGKTYDVYFGPSCFGGTIQASFYEVKRPHRKFFGRTKVFSTVSGWEWVEDFETIDELLMAIFNKGIKKYEAELELIKKCQEFLKNT